MTACKLPSFPPSRAFAMGASAVLLANRAFVKALLALAAAVCVAAGVTRESPDPEVLTAGRRVAEHLRAGAGAGAGGGSADEQCADELEALRVAWDLARKTKGTHGRPASGNARASDRGRGCYRIQARAAMLTYSGAPGRSSATTKASCRPRGAARPTPTPGRPRQRQGHPVARAPAQKASEPGGKVLGAGAEGAAGARPAGRLGKADRVGPMAVSQYDRRIPSRLSLVCSLSGTALAKRTVKAAY